jgi:hypothetical protein
MRRAILYVQQSLHYYYLRHSLHSVRICWTLLSNAQGYSNRIFRCQGKNLHSSHRCNVHHLLLIGWSWSYR